MLDKEILILEGEYLSGKKMVMEKFKNQIIIITITKIMIIA